MSLVTTKQLLLDAQKGGYAIGAFNTVVTAIPTPIPQMQPALWN